jgi:NAD(P)-dependent dehydrogenase (short-subunit alcohol dehydrogenase family)
MELSEKIAVITGAGSGIGQAVALEFSRARAKIVCCGRRESKLLETASLIQEVGGEALVVPTDVTQKDQVDSMVTRTLEHFGRIDVLLNNAGSFSILGGLWEVDADLWWKDVETILRGTMLCCQAALPHMIKRDKGIIVNMSGGGAEAPMTGGSGYGCSKAAVLRLTDTLAAELRRAGSSVMVFAMDPGFNRTAMTEGLAYMKGVDKWLPHVHRYLDMGDGNKPQDCARTMMELIRLAIPQLSGRIFHAGMDIEKVAKNADEIYEKDLRVLRPRY